MAGDEVDGTVARGGAGTLFADPLALEAQVCFALSAGARGMVALYRPLLEPLGITHPQYLVLLALWQDDAAGTTSTVGDLAARLHLDAGTLSPLLKRLEALGYVRRWSRAPPRRGAHPAVDRRGHGARPRRARRGARRGVQGRRRRAARGRLLTTTRLLPAEHAVLARQVTRTGGDPVVGGVVRRR